MIKAIIADVDGVMVGKQEGVNFPLPHGDVINMLRTVRRNGIPIMLCTAKFGAAINPIIIKAHLANPHITDGGALIIDPLGETKIIEQNVIDATVVQDYLAHDKAATELYSATDYLVQKDAYAEVIRQHATLLQREPVLVDNLAEAASTTQIIKMISFADNDNDIPRVEQQLEHLEGRLNFIWTQHPYLLPNRLCVMTAPGVSKEHAAAKVAGYLGISPDEILGIGDSPADWDFMKLCGYAATVGNSKELQQLAKTKQHFYIGKSVDDNAIIDVFEHFGLTNT